MVWKQIIADGEQPMKKTVEKMRGELSSMRTGRANVALVDGLALGACDLIST